MQSSQGKRKGTEMKRTANTIANRRNDDKCKHAAHARHNIVAREHCDYNEDQKAHDCHCPRCGRTTRPNMFVCPHCGMHIAIPQVQAEKRAVQAEVRMSATLRPVKTRSTRRSARPVPRKRQRYMSEEMAAQLAATIPAVA